LCGGLLRGRGVLHWGKDITRVRGRPRRHGRRTRITKSGRSAAADGTYTTARGREAGLGGDTLFARLGKGRACRPSRA
jgi:hypothetical protein